MPAPLVSALGYLLAPRALGAAADQIARARMDSLMSQAQTENLPYEQVSARISSDPYLAALSIVPRQSGAESAFDALRALYDVNTQPIIPAEQAPDAPLGTVITREDPYGGAQFLTPMDNYLRYGGRDEDDVGQLRQQSYGQTDQPATEVRFDEPPGGANGGLAALLRSRYAKR